MIYYNEENVFSTRYHIVRPGQLKSGNTDFICMISAYVKKEDTKINDDVSIMLRVARFEKEEDCEPWVIDEVKNLGQWYLDVSVRDYLKSVLSDENFQYLLDEEAELLKESKNA